MRLTLHEAAIAAAMLMEKYQLTDWSIAFDKRAKRAGACYYGKKLIVLSENLVLNNDALEVKETILHEIAHALAGHAAGHGQAWKAICVLIGCKPVACYNPNEVAMPKGKYRAVCTGCGRAFRKHRMPRRGKACGGCGRTLTFTVDFDAWMADVNTAVAARMGGLTAECLPDVDYRAMFSGGMSARAAAKHAIREAKNS